MWSRRKTKEKKRWGEGIIGEATIDFLWRIDGFTPSVRYFVPALKLFAFYNAKPTAVDGFASGIVSLLIDDLVVAK